MGVLTLDVHLPSSGYQAWVTLKLTLSVFMKNMISSVSTCANVVLPGSYSNTILGCFIDLAGAVGCSEPMLTDGIVTTTRFVTLACVVS